MEEVRCSDKRVINDSWCAKFMEINMNIYDILIIVAVASAMILIGAGAVKRKKRGQAAFGCCGNCDNCAGCAAGSVHHIAK